MNNEIKTKCEHERFSQSPAHDNPIKTCLDCNASLPTKTWQEELYNFKNPLDDTQATRLLFEKFESFISNLLDKTKSDTLVQVKEKIGKLEKDMHDSEADGEYANGIVAGLALVKQELNQTTLEE